MLFRSNISHKKSKKIKFSSKLVDTKGKAVKGKKIISIKDIPKTMDLAIITASRFALDF